MPNLNGDRMDVGTPPPMGAPGEVACPKCGAKLTLTAAPEPMKMPGAGDADMGEATSPVSDMISGKAGRFS